MLAITKGGGVRSRQPSRIGHAIEPSRINLSVLERYWQGLDEETSAPPQPRPIGLDDDVVEASCRGAFQLCFLVLRTSRWETSMGNLR
jgi:hypothetical protein